MSPSLVPLSPSLVPLSPSLVPLTLPEGSGHLDAGRKKQSLFARTVPGSHVLGSSSTPPPQEHRPRGAYSQRAAGSTTSTLLSESASESM